MRTNIVWRMIAQPTNFVIYDDQTLIVRVPRRSLNARQNACVIARFPQMIDAACFTAEQADRDTVSAVSIQRLRRILDGTVGYSDSPWRARGRSVWGFGRQRLIATASDARISAIAAGAAELVSVLQFVVDHAEEAAVHRTPSCALTLLRTTAWTSRFGALWRAPRPRLHRHALPALLIANSQ